MSTEVLERLAATLPPVFARSAVPLLTGGLLSSRTMANLDAKRQGPKLKQMVGNRIMYERSDFISWLESRTSSLNREK